MKLKIAIFFMLVVFNLVIADENLGKQSPFFKVKGRVELDCGENKNVSFYYIDIKSKDAKETLIENDNYYTIVENKLTIKNLTNQFILNSYLCRDNRDMNLIKTFNEHPRILALTSLKHPNSEKPKISIKSQGSDYILNCSTHNDSSSPLIKFFVYHGVERQELNVTDRLTVNETTGVLKISNILSTDNGIYECIASNSFGVQSYKIQLKIKNDLDSLWPFIGIAIQVLIFCVLVFIWEKRNLRKEISIQKAQNAEITKQEYRPTHA